MAKKPAKPTKSEKKPASTGASKRVRAQAAVEGASADPDAIQAAAKPKVAKANAPKRENSRSIISRLAADILEDRILPTIEQVKSIAASVLGPDGSKTKKAKLKKRK